MSEEEALAEFACHLFDTGRLALRPAANLAGMSQVEFEAELTRRKIAIYGPSPEDLACELAAMKRLGI